MESQHDEEAGWQPRTTFAGNTYVVPSPTGTHHGTFPVDPAQQPKEPSTTRTVCADAAYRFRHLLSRATASFLRRGQRASAATAFKTYPGKACAFTRESE